MARSYEDLSRRGLIKLNKDFDQDNEEMLLHYLMENEDSYEGIRPVESVIDRIDKVSDAFSESKGGIKRFVTNGVNNLIDSVIDAISGVSD